MSFHGHYIGYGDLEKMLEATTHCGNVFANCIFESSPAQPQIGMDYCTTLIQVSRIDGEVVHFWRWKIATVLRLATGEPYSAEDSRRARIAGESAWDAVKDWLGEKTTMIEAAVAMPRNMNYPGGECPAFLDYDKNTYRYVLREVSHV